MSDLRNGFCSSHQILQNISEFLKGRFVLNTIEQEHLFLMAKAMAILLMEEILNNHQGCIPNPVNNGINYQP